MRNVDGVGLLIQDSYKIEIDNYPDGIMLWAYLWKAEPPVSIGVEAWVWEKVKTRYAKSIELKLQKD